MAVATVEELKAWFETLADMERICRVWLRDGSHSRMCGREAVGMDRLGGKNALVCEAHKPKEQWFVRLAAGE